MTRIEVRILSVERQLHRKMKRADKMTLVPYRDLAEIKRDEAILVRLYQLRSKVNG